MKKVFFRYNFVCFCLFLLCNIAAYAHSIVFVHIGSSIPDYLSIALQQARLFNKECPIYVIGNEEAFKSCPFVFDETIHCISCESLARSQSHCKFVNSSRLDKKAFEGFWTFTSERFFYLEELVQKYQLTNVFHLENDIMLYVDLARLLPVFQQNYCGMIGATFDNDMRGIPGFVYISDLEPLSQFTQLMGDLARAGKNDMEMLQEFKNRYHGVYIKHLPIVIPQYSVDYGLKNELHQVAKCPEFFFQHFDHFGSVFDAAAIGQYLGGISPRNGPMIPGFINESCFFNPSYFLFQWEKDSEGRLIPYLLYKNEKYPINNLHIHSKNLFPFFSHR